MSAAADVLLLGCCRFCSGVVARSDSAVCDDRGVSSGYLVLSSSLPSVSPDAEDSPPSVSASSVGRSPPSSSTRRRPRRHRPSVGCPRPRGRCPHRSPSPAQPLAPPVTSLSATAAVSLSSTRHCPSVLVRLSRGLGAGADRSRGGVRGRRPGAGRRAGRTGGCRGLRHVRRRRPSGLPVRVRAAEQLAGDDGGDPADGDDDGQPLQPRPFFFGAADSPWAAATAALPRSVASTTTGCGSGRGEGLGQLRQDVVSSWSSPPRPPAAPCPARPRAPDRASPPRPGPPGHSSASRSSRTVRPPRSPAGRTGRPGRRRHRRRAARTG